MTDLHLQFRLRVSTMGLIIQEMCMPISITKNGCLLLESSKAKQISQIVLELWMENTLESSNCNTAVPCFSITTCDKNLRTLPETTQVAVKSTLGCIEKRFFFQKFLQHFEKYVNWCKNTQVKI